MTILIKNSNKKTGSEIVDETYLTYLKDWRLSLPNIMLTFKLLDNEKLAHNDRWLAFSLGGNLEFETMKSALKRIFTKTTSTPEPPRDLDHIEQEK